MDLEKQGVIALKLVKYYLRQKGVRLQKDSLRELKNVAKAIDVQPDELLEFIRPLIQEVVNEIFTPQK